MTNDNHGILRRWALLAAGAGLGLGSCGGESTNNSDGTGSAGSSNSGSSGNDNTASSANTNGGLGGVDETQTLGELDAEEARSLCDAINTRVLTSAVPGLCILLSADDANSAAQCEAGLEDCEQDIAGDPGFDEDECAADLSASSCGASVRLLERCLDEAYGPLEEIARGGCQAYLDDPIGVADLTAPSCDELDQLCPELSEESGNPTEPSEDAAIVGRIDSEAVGWGDPASGVAISALAGDDGSWSLKASYNTATVYLWNHEAETRGLVEVPHQGQGAADWICLASVATPPGPNQAGLPEDWSSSDLSRLSCTLAEGEPLRLTFDIGDEGVDGTYRGDAVNWTNSGYASDFGRVAFFFEQPDGMELELSLDLGDSRLQDEGPIEVLSGVLVVAGGNGAVGCTGPGTLTSDGQVFTLDIEQASPLASCPGEPVEGQLQGSFD